MKKISVTWARVVQRYVFPWHSAPPKGGGRAGPGWGSDGVTTLHQPQQGVSGYIHLTTCPDHEKLPDSSLREWQDVSTLK